MQVAMIKGLITGTVNVGIALMLGAHVPGAWRAAPAMQRGFIGYGVSLVPFVLALRQLGTARTGAYFSTAPSVGAVASLVHTHAHYPDLHDAMVTRRRASPWSRHRHACSTSTASTNTITPTKPIAAATTKGRAGDERQSRPPKNAAGAIARLLIR